MNQTNDSTSQTDHSYNHINNLIKKSHVTDDNAANKDGPTAHMYDSQLQRIESLISRLAALIHQKTTLNDDSFRQVLTEFLPISFSFFAPVEAKIAEFDALLKANIDRLHDDGKCLYLMYLAKKKFLFGNQNVDLLRPPQTEVYHYLVRAAELCEPLAMRALAHTILTKHVFAIDESIIEWAIDCIVYLDTLNTDMSQTLKNDLEQTYNWHGLECKTKTIPRKGLLSYTNLVFQIIERSNNLSKDENDQPRIQLDTMRLMSFNARPSESASISEIDEEASSVKCGY